eukprot:7147122-Karenia_brevis.AAC.1
MVAPRSRLFTCMRSSAIAFMAFQPCLRGLAGVGSAAGSTDFGSMFFSMVPGCRGWGDRDSDAEFVSPGEKVQSLMLIKSRA